MRQLEEWESVRGTSAALSKLKPLSVTARRRNMAQHKHGGRAERSSGLASPGHPSRSRYMLSRRGEHTSPAIASTYYTTGSIRQGESTFPERTRHERPLSASNARTPINTIHSLTSASGTQHGPSGACVNINLPANARLQVPQGNTSPLRNVRKLFGSSLASPATPDATPHKDGKELSACHLGYRLNPTDARFDHWARACFGGVP